MKKILIIENQPDYEIGGIESYNRKLTEIINNNFKDIIIDKVAIYHPNSNKNFNFSNNQNYYYAQSKKYNENLNFFDWILSIFLTRKLVAKLCSRNNYDLIIDSTLITYKKLLSKNNYWWIQHQTPQYYEHNFYKGLKKVLIKIGCFVLGVKNNLYFANNLVLYDQDNYNYILNKRKTPFNFKCIPLCCNVPKNFLPIIDQQYSFRKRIIYLGRIDNKQKNIQLLIDINKQLDLIDFYGNGSTDLIQQMGDHYKGEIYTRKNRLEIISKYKWMILASNYEGFSFSLVEALAVGVPIIVWNNFISAQYLVNNNQNGYLVKSDEKIDSYSTQIKNFNSIESSLYLKMCKNAYLFALNNLNIDVFTQDWLNILNNYLI